MAEREGSLKRWLLGAGAAIAAVVSLANPAVRKRANDSISRAADYGRRQIATSVRGLQESAARVGRVALLPADATLELARDRVLSGVPEAADTKWRATGLMLRSSIVHLVGGDPGAAAAALETAGQTYAEASAPANDWDGVMVREAVRRVTRSLDMEADERRTNGAIESTTSRCPLLDTIEPDHAAAREQLCEVVCGERLSLMHGIAVAAGWQLATTRRMGRGDATCLRTFTPTEEGAAT